MINEPDNGNTKTDESPEVDDGPSSTPAYDETIVMDTSVDDTTIDASAELKVDALVARIEKEGDEAAEQLAARRKLDEIELRKKIEEDLGDTYNINLDDEL
jgi:hypothetical protein